MSNYGIATHFEDGGMCLQSERHGFDVVFVVLGDDNVGSILVRADELGHIGAVVFIPDLVGELPELSLVFSCYVFAYALFLPFGSFGGQSFVKPVF